jgi:hypothetical protein
MVVESQLPINWPIFHLKTSQLSIFSITFSYKTKVWLAFSLTSHVFSSIFEEKKAKCMRDNSIYLRKMTQFRNNKIKTFETSWNTQANQHAPLTVAWACFVILKLFLRWMFTLLKRKEKKTISWFQCHERMFRVYRLTNIRIRPALILKNLSSSAEIAQSKPVSLRLGSDSRFWKLFCAADSASTFNVVLRAFKSVNEKTMIMHLHFDKFRWRFNDANGNVDKCLKVSVLGIRLTLISVSCLPSNSEYFCVPRNLKCNVQHKNWHGKTCLRTQPPSVT